MPRKAIQIEYSMIPPLTRVKIPLVRIVVQFASQFATREVVAQPSLRQKRKPQMLQRAAPAVGRGGHLCHDFSATIMFIGAQPTTDSYEKPPES